MQTYKAAVIGAGRIGLELELDEKRSKPASHAGMWLNHVRTQLVGLADPNKKQAEIGARIAPEAKFYTDPEEMLAATKPDIVSIATPHELHHDMVMLALKHGARLIICEKPIADSIEDAQNMVDAARDKGSVLIINHVRRFSPFVERFRQQLHDGLLGDLLQISSYYVYGLVSTGTHLIDLYRYLLKDLVGEITWVQGRFNAFENFAPEGDPNIDGIIGFENGLIATLQSLNMKDYDLFDQTFYGRKGKAVLGDLTRVLDFYPAVASNKHSGFTELPLKPEQTWHDSGYNPFQALAENAVSCLDGSDTPRSSGDDAIMALKILIAMRQSAEQDGQRVMVK